MMMIMKQVAFSPLASMNDFRSECQKKATRPLPNPQVRVPRSEWIQALKIQ